MCGRIGIQDWLGRNHETEAYGPSLEDYALPLSADHGVFFAHWARALENGLKLAEQTGANAEVVSLFAILHESRRINECTDLDHGQRGADFAIELRGHLFDLPNYEFNLLRRACVGHTHERTHPDITIQTCWDSDRLDLGRVGIMPHPSRLCTKFAKPPETSGLLASMLSAGW